MEGSVKKKLILLFAFLLALTSFILYLFLTKEIIIGNFKIAQGQQQLMEGEQQLASGEARLASGKQELSRAKKSYNKFKAAPLLALSTLPVAGQIAVVVGDEYTRKKIAMGNRQVAAGAQKVDAGKAQLAEGKLQLQQGIIKLKRANAIRIACGVSALFFTLMTIFLLFVWRKSLLSKS